MQAAAGTPSTGLRAGCLRGRGLTVTLQESGFRNRTWPSSKRLEVHRLTTGVQGWKRHDCRSLLVTGSQLFLACILADRCFLRREMVFVIEAHLREGS